MANTINSQKLLPAARSSAIVKVDKSKSLNFLTKKTSVKSGALVKTESKESRDVNNKLVRIDKFFKSELIASQRSAEQTRKKDEKQDFEEAEKKLETPKMVGLGLPKFPQLPKIGFLERIKRFIFFTAVGWALPTILELLPKLEGILKIIGGVYKFAEGLFGKLFDGFMSFVKFGGDLKDKTIGFIASAKSAVGGGDYQTEFNKLEKQFNDFANLSIVAGLLSLDIGLAAVDEFKKWRGKQRPKTPEGPKPSKVGGKIGSKVTVGRGGEPGLGKRKPKVTTGKGGKVPGWWNRIFKGPFAKLKGPLSRFAGAAVPGLGAVVGAADSAARFKAGDKIGGSLAAVSAGLDAITAILAATGVGVPAAALFGTVSMGIDVILLINDIGKVIKETWPMMRWLPTFNKGGRIVRRYQGGGTTTRAGKPVGTPARRTIAPVRRKPKIKIQPPKSQPGKDVGGESKIQKLYPDTDPKIVTAKDWMSGDFAGTFQQYLESIKDRKDKIPNPFKAITSTAKILKEIPLVGGIMGAAVDIALGQKPDARVYRSLASGISYLVESIANQRTNESVISLLRDIRGFTDGGNIPASRELRNNYSSLNSEDLLSKVLGPTIEQRVNEAIKGIQKELQKKDVKPDRKGPGDRNDAGPDGNIGVYPGSISVSGGNADFWTLVAITALETENSQGRADVAQSIYNRVASRLNFGQRNNTIKDHIIAPGQYSPVGESNRSLWEGIVDKQSAIAAIESHSRGRGRGRLLVDAAVAAITDSSLQKNAAEFVGGRTDFNSTSVYPQDPRDGVGITSRLGHRFGWFVGPESKSFGRRNPGPASVPSLGASVTRTQEIQDFSSNELIPHTGPGGFLQGSSGHGMEDYPKYGVHFHLSPPNTSKDGLLRARNVAVLSIRKMLARGSTVYLPNIRRYVPRDASDSTIRSLVLSEQNAHTAPGRTQGGIDIQEQNPNVGPTHRGLPGSKIAFPFAVGNVRSLTQGGGYGREADIIGSGGVVLAHGAEGSTSSQIQRLERTQQSSSIKPQEQPTKPQEQPTKPPGSRTGTQLAEGLRNLQQPRAQTNPIQQFWQQFTGTSAARGKDNKRKGVINFGGQVFFILNGKYYQEVKSGPEKGVTEIPKEIYDQLKIHLNSKQGGGLISPSKSNRPIPNSFASYESPGNGMMLAIQPIIIERPIPVGRSRGSIIDFIPTSVNNTNTTPLSIG